MSNWISMHIFYSSNCNPLLVECVAPLVERLRSRGLLERYFYIRYWLGGPHVRLRVLPSEAADASEVRALMEEAAAAYLERRPALFVRDERILAPLYREMYIAEYGQEEFEARYGEDGVIPLYEDNSIHYIDYEQELERYGGAHGMELSEKHFEVSSDVTIKLAETRNVHLRTILLGGGVQLMLHLCYGMLDGDEEVASFLDRYRKFWVETYNKQADSPKLYPMFDKKYERMAPRLHSKIQAVRRQIEAGDAFLGTEVERRWARHIRELRADIKRLADADLIEMRGGMKASEPVARQLLLTSYIHMTNNRLGVNILDEVYLSYIIGRALEGSGAGRPEEVAVGGY